MTSRHKQTPGPSALAMFLPPEDYSGYFAWVCGFSADAPFLNGALSNFTGASESQRGYSARLVCLLMLDPHALQIPTRAVPGLHHALLRDDRNRAFKLMHAKVAILVFKHNTRPEDLCVRLVVSTGNWTQQTLNDSLDIAWHTDIFSAYSSEERGAWEFTASCSDLQRAWSLMQEIAGYYDIRIFTDPTKSDATQAAYWGASKWLHSLAQAAQGADGHHFFDSRTASLLEQIPAKVEAVTSKATARTSLSIGAGFFEGSPNADPSPRIPHVLQRILNVLQDKGKRLLTADPDVDVFVNPLACQSMAHAVDAFAAKNAKSKKGAQWHIREPRPPKWLSGARTLHAKFIFCAYNSDDEIARSGWAYIGSGNMTEAGLLRSARSGGNLEAGVVVDVEDAYWDALSDKLPVQYETSLMKGDAALQHGASFELSNVESLAPPISLVQLRKQMNQYVLEPDGRSDAAYELLDGRGGKLIKDTDGFFVWPYEPPTVIEISWKLRGVEHQCEIPVRDEHGRYAGVSLPPLQLQEAWATLASFPELPADDDLSDGAVDFANVEGTKAQTTRSAGSYPIRDMMELLENIGATQVEMPVELWEPWCRRLQTTMSQAAKSDAARATQTFQVDILATLKSPAFRPTYACIPGSPEAIAYESVIDKLRQAFDIDAFPPFGGTP